MSFGLFFKCHEEVFRNAVKEQENNKQNLKPFTHPTMISIRLISIFIFHAYVQHKVITKESSTFKQILFSK